MQSGYKLLPWKQFFKREVNRLVQIVFQLLIVDINILGLKTFSDMLDQQMLLIARPDFSGLDFLHVR